MKLKLHEIMELEKIRNIDELIKFIIDNGYKEIIFKKLS